ncbi:hypothetical protein HGB07_07390 [Candidatus Roizmanbacteria bacterium]|nr:hypothetical protein [Candidatus Roizmanbacteria bacterium]
MEANANQSDIGPRREFTYFQKKKRKFSTAMSERLARGVVRLRSVTEFTHNINHIVDEGLGWESFYKYTEQISSADIDWYIMEERDLDYAYNLYVQNLQTYLAFNHRVTPPSFGRENDNEGLDDIQKMVQMQLRATRLARTGADPNDPRALRRDTRMARLASALAKGYTNEFWGVLMDATMPISYTYDKKTGKKKTNTTFVGTHSKGVDRMLALISPRKQRRRFTPGKFQLIGDVDIPRDPEKYDGPYRDPFSHSRAIRVRTERDAAFFDGGSYWFLNHTNKNISYDEWCDLNLIDQFSRTNSWRGEQYRAYVIGDPATEKIDVRASIAQLSAVGSIALRGFIDGDLFEGAIKDMPDADYVALVGENKPTDIGVARRQFFEKFIFDHILDVTATRAINFERRMYTPKGEKTIYEMLYDHSAEFFSSRDVNGKIIEDNSKRLIREKVLSLYVQAMQLAEKQYARTKKDEFKKLWFDSKGDPRTLQVLQYKFTETTLQQLINNSEIGGNAEPTSGFLKTLKVLFKEYVGDFGTLLNYNGESQTMEDSTFDTFVRSLPGFYRVLRDGVDNNAVRERGVREAKAEGYDLGFNKRLSSRFKQWYDWGHLIYDLGGEDAEMTEIFMQTSGSRYAARSLSDVNNDATKIIPATGKVTDTVLPRIVLANPHGKDEIHALAEKELLPVMREAIEVLRTIDDKLADKFAVQWTLFITRMIGKDRLFRVAGVGDLIGFAVRQWGGRQQSLYQDVLESSMERHTAALSADECLELAKTVLSPLGVYMKSDRIDIMSVPKKFLGIDIPVRTDKKDNPYTFETFKKVDGHKFVNKFFERFIPVVGIAALVILIALFMAARKKDKK